MFKLASIREDSIGHIILNARLCALSNIIEKKPIIIVANKKKICNQAAVELALEILKTKYKIHYSTNLFLRLMYYVIAKFWRKYRIFSNIYFNLEWIHLSKKNLKYGSIYDFNSFNPAIDITIDYPDKFVSKYQDWLCANSIVGPVVLVFCRDGNYHKSTENDIRNSDAEALIPSINFLLKNGYTVIRIGRQLDKLISPSKSGRFLNYQESYLQSDYVEIELIRNATFILSSNSGINHLQQCFQTPILLHNFTPAGLVPSHNNCRFIMKKYKKNQKFVPFGNLETSILLSENIEKLSELGYSLTDNSSTEILSLVKNYVLYPEQEQINPSSSFFKSGAGGKIDKKWFERNHKLFE